MLSKRPHLSGQKLQVSLPPKIIFLDWVEFGGKLTSKNQNVKIYCQKDHF